MGITASLIRLFMIFEHVSCRKFKEKQRKNKSLNSLSQSNEHSVITCHMLSVTKYVDLGL